MWARDVFSGANTRFCRCKAALIALDLGNKALLDGPLVSYNSSGPRFRGGGLCKNDPESCLFVIRAT